MSKNAQIIIGALVIIVIIFLGWQYFRGNAVALPIPTPSATNTNTESKQNQANVINVSSRDTSDASIDKDMQSINVESKTLETY